MQRRAKQSEKAAAGDASGGTDPKVEEMLKEVDAEFLSMMREDEEKQASEGADESGGANGSTQGSTA